jgi:hypothetical protein
MILFLAYYLVLGQIVVAAECFWRQYVGRPMGWADAVLILVAWLPLLLLALSLLLWVGLRAVWQGVAWYAWWRHQGELTFSHDYSRGL